MADGVPWAIRGYRPTDRNRILKDWTSVNRRCAPYKWMGREAYAVHDRKIVAVLPACDILICHDPVDKDVIYGWCVASRELSTLHMCFVRPGPFRNHGMGRKLMKTMFGDLRGLSYTHRTHLIDKFKLDERWGLVHYNPYVLDQINDIVRIK